MSWIAGEMPNELVIPARIDLQLRGVGVVAKAFRDLSVAVDAFSRGMRQLDRARRAHAIRAQNARRAK